MTTKIKNPNSPTSRMPAPATFDIWENSSQLGVLASFSTRTYDAKSNGTSIPEIVTAGFSMY